MRKFLTFVVIFLVVFGAIGAFWLTPRYNELVGLEEQVKKEWAQVDTLLQRRFELIPQLVSTVKGYSQHEKDVFFGITDSLSRYKNAKSMNNRIAAAHETEGFLARLRYLGRIYPTIKADRHFLKLMGSLEKTEDQIAAQRMKFNEAASVLNTKVRSVEGKLVSSLTGVHEVSYYDPAAHLKENPVVDFTGERKDEKAAFDQRQRELKGTADPSSMVSQVRFQGVVIDDDNKENVRAILQLPGGETKTVGSGDTLLELRARIVSIDATGVVIDEHLPSGVHRVRLTR